MTKRILHMPVTNSGSGVTKYIFDNWRFLRDRDFIFDFVTRNSVADFADQVANSGGRVHYLTCSSSENEQVFRREMNNILSFGYDAVHLHTSFWNGFLAEKLAKEHRCPIVIVHAHNTMVDIEDEEARERAIKIHREYRQRFSMDLATYFCACSKQAAEWLFGDAVPKENVIFLRNAIDTDLYAFNHGIRDKVRAYIGLQDNLVLGHIGRFTYQKNHEMLLRIFLSVFKKNPAARLLLVGDGPLFDKTRETAAAMEIDRYIMFLGKRQDVPDLLQAMDVYLQPSRFEGLSIALVEAQAAGLPCLASEHMDKEVKLTTNLQFLPDDLDVWTKAVEGCSRHERRDCSATIAAKGFALKKQVDIVERLYAEAT